MDKPPLNRVREALTAETAFVVHLGANKAGASEVLHGRVEHVRSGQSRRFVSVEELVAFMCQTFVTHR